MQEGLSQTLGLDEVHATAGHPAILVNATQRLNEGSAALPALIPLCLHQETGRHATNGAVSEGDVGTGCQ
jgi:hypothetical protein